MKKLKTLMLVVLMAGFVGCATLQDVEVEFENKETGVVVKHTAEEGLVLDDGKNQSLKLKVPRKVEPKE